MGKTTKNLPDTTLLPNVHNNVTENHWQSTESIYQYLHWMDALINHDSPTAQWSVILDAAP
eukprot:2996149-Amphidinium_carterae.1